MPERGRCLVPLASKGRGSGVKVANRSRGHGTLSPPTVIVPRQGQGNFLFD